jgi:hypothetical protein
MSKRGLKAAVLVWIIFFAGCSTGLYTRMNSTTPSFGPVLPGMTRAEAENYLGTPVLKTRMSEDRYWAVYEYELEMSVKETWIMDLLDFTTAGMGTLIVNPVDRFKGSEHFIEVVYRMEDSFEMNDRIVEIHGQMEAHEKDKPDEEGGK